MRVLVVLTLACAALMHALLTVLFVQALRFLIHVLWFGGGGAKRAPKAAANAAPKQERWAA